jgi:hypothetical protein
MDFWISWWKFTFTDYIKICATFYIESIFFDFMEYDLSSIPIQNKPLKILTKFIGLFGWVFGSLKFNCNNTVDNTW